MAEVNTDKFSLERWGQLWDAGTTTWHKEEVRGLIVKYYEQLTNKGEFKRILVPLCGKSKEILFFHQQGHEVVGIEFSYKACQDFFQENGIKFSVESQESGKDGESGNVFTSEDKRIVLYQGDFYSVSKEKLGDFDAVLDWNSLTAIDPDKRLVYIDMVIGFLKPGGRMLLNTFIYPKVEHAGPPCAIFKEEILKYYSGRMKVELLEENKEGTEDPRKRFKLSELTFLIYLFTKM